MVHQETKYLFKIKGITSFRIKMYRMEKSEVMSEITKKVKDLVADLKIDIDILR